MAFLTINTQTTDHLISALCNTLAHSLWQGVLLAAVTGLIIIFTRKARAAVRYNLLIMALLLFAAGMAITFATQFKPLPTPVAINQFRPLTQSHQALAPIGPTAINIEASGFTAIIKDYLGKHHNTIVLVWFLIICARSMQLAIGLWGVKRLKHTQTTVNVYWAARVQQLARSIAVKQSVAFFESVLVKVPMVIGNLKPVILVPVGLLTALSTEEVEAILVHELAHIKRRDYLVNILQSLMEIIFFFNPAVLWISQLIKTERENCCDDLALAQSSSRVNYIRALVGCEEYQAAVPAYAMAFPGGKRSLFDRVKRIAGNRNHSLNLFEKTALAVCVVVSGVCLTAFSEKESIKHMKDKIVSAIQHTETVQTKQVVVDKQSIVPTKQHKVVVKGTAEPVIFSDPVKDTIVKTLAAVNSISNLSFNTGTHLNLIGTCLPPLGVQLAALNTKTNITLNTNFNLKSDVKIKGTADSSYKTYNYKYDAQSNLWHNKPEDKVNIETQPDKPGTDTIKKTKLSTKQVSAHRVVMQSLTKLITPKLNLKLQIPSISDLLYDTGLIKDKENFSAFINNDVLIVNGQTQPEEKHRQLLEKYQKKPGDNVNLSFTYGNPPGRIVPVK